MAADLKVLLTNNKTPNYNLTTALIVGSTASQNVSLANALVEANKAYRLQVRLSSQLPLTEENDERPRIDYLIFVVDLANRLSLKSTENSLKAVDVNFFLGKACVLVTEAELCDTDVDLELVIMLADKYDLPLFRVDLQSATGLQNTAEKMVNLIELSSGMKGGVNALLIDTTRQPFQKEMDPFL